MGGLVVDGSGHSVVDRQWCHSHRGHEQVRSVRQDKHRVRRDKWGIVGGGVERELLVMKQPKSSQGEHRQTVLQVSTLARPIGIIIISVVVVDCQHQAFQNFGGHGLAVVIPEQQLQL
jgi:hypothetical protein